MGDKGLTLKLKTWVTVLGVKSGNTFSRLVSLLLSSIYLVMSWYYTGKLQINLKALSLFVKNTSDLTSPLLYLKIRIKRIEKQGLAT